MMERVLFQQNASHEVPEIQQVWQALLDAMPTLPQTAQQVLQEPADPTSLTWEWAIATAGTAQQIADLMHQHPLHEWHLAHQWWLLARGIAGDRSVWKFLWERIHEICHALQEDASLIAVAVGLGNSGSDRAWHALEPMLVHQSPTVRAAVYGAVATLGETRARDYLRKALTNEQEPPVVESVIEALGSVGETQDASAIIDYAFQHRHFRTAVVQALVRMGSAALPAIRDYLRDGYDDTLKERLIDALQQIGTAEVLPVLNEGYHRLESDKLRRQIVQAVGALGHPEGIPLLVAALGDRSERIRTLASDGLIRFGEAAVEPLLEHLEHPQWDRERYYLARWAAGRTLARIGGDTVKQRMQELVDSYDMNLRWVALTTLRYADYPDLGNWIAQKLPNSPWTIQHECAIYLWKYPTLEAIPLLMEELRNPHAALTELLEAAVAANGVAAIPILQQGFEQWKAYRQRMGIVNILHRIGHPAGLTLLSQLVQDTDPRIAKRAHEVYQEILGAGNTQ
jgi:HEAT repeat protein